MLHTTKDEDMKLKMEIRTQLNLPYKNLKATAPHGLET
jgi:hypothetical protein